MPENEPGKIVRVVEPGGMETLYFPCGCICTFDCGIADTHILCALHGITAMELPFLGFEEVEPGG